MTREGTNEEYRARLNARRREQKAEKRRTMGTEEWKELPWLPLEWTEQQHEEDTVQSIRANALDQVDQYL